jgi:hypothetical protein
MLIFIFNFIKNKGYKKHLQIMNLTKSTLCKCGSNTNYNYFLVLFFSGIIPIRKLFRTVSLNHYRYLIGIRTVINGKMAGTHHQFIQNYFDTDYYVLWHIIENKMLGIHHSKSLSNPSKLFFYI